MEKKFRLLGLSLLVAVFLSASAYDEKFYIKEYANLKVPKQHVEKLYKFKKDKVKIITANLPTLISLSAKVVWDNLSTEDLNKKGKAVAWAAEATPGSGSVVKDIYQEQRGQALNKNLKESYLAINDYLHLVVMEAELKTNPEAILAQQEAIDMYQKTELFTITPAQQQEILKTKANHAKGVKNNYRNALVQVTELNRSATGAGLKSSLKKVQILQNKVKAAVEEVDGYLQITALQIQTSVREGQALAQGTSQDAVPAGVEIIQPEGPIVVEKYQPPVSAYPRTASANYQVTQKALGKRSDRVLRWSNQIIAAANKYGVEPALVAAIIEQESGGNENAISHAGAIGLMQLMPGTARGLGVNPYDPVQNIDGGTKYIARQLAYYNGDVTLSLAAYNAGGRNARRWQSIPETRHYVQIVPQLRIKYLEVFKAN